MQFHPERQRFNFLLSKRHIPKQRLGDESAYTVNDLWGTLGTLRGTFGELTFGTPLGNKLIIVNFENFK